MNWATDWRCSAVIAMGIIGNNITAMAATDTAATNDTPCLITPGALPASAPQFDAFRVDDRWTGRPASVDLKSDPNARRFRTRLSAGASQGPNFGGHYTIVGWGCGTSCLEWAIVDAQSGKVRFEPSIHVVSALNVTDDAPAPSSVNSDFYALRFRLDSNLLMVLGAPNEDESRDGIAFYRWTGRSFALVTAIPRKDTCRPPE